ncbi:MAG: DUF58 domain-containing protein [Planctomycetota bacterium]|nr:DUF58 domain-containing protein [Planctomycetota bacterium]
MKRDPFAGTQPPCPGALEPRDFMARLQCLSGAFARQRARSEGYGGDPGAGRGQEFIGYRPYRVGEDARALDFLMLARLGKPFVRIQRSEVQAHLCMLVDTSDSMAVGPPGKWQSAAEIVAAWAHVACLAGSEVSVVHAQAGSAPQILHLHKPAQWRDFAGQLFRIRARGGADLSELLQWRGLQKRWSQVVCVGDLFDAQPNEFELHLRGNVPWTLVRIMAPLEVAPDESEATVWLHPKGRGDARSDGGVAGHWAYLRRLAENQELWRSWAAQHRVGLLNHSSANAFEEVFLGSGHGLGGVL